MTDTTRETAQRLVEDWHEGVPEAERLDWSCRAAGTLAALAALPASEVQPVLQDIEQYRLQMAGICTAAFGYWEEGDAIHPDYDTPAIHDVAKLYAKYAVLYAKNEALASEVQVEPTTGECLMVLAVVRELTGTQQQDLDATLDAVRALAAVAPLPKMSDTAAQELKRLADEYAHCYAFVADETMPLKRAELHAAIDRLVS